VFVELLFSSVFISVNAIPGIFGFWYF